MRSKGTLRCREDGGVEKMGRWSQISEGKKWNLDERTDKMRLERGRPEARRVYSKEK